MSISSRVHGPSDSEHKLFKDALDQVELADHLGFDYVWETEHHFLEEYAHSSAPEIFLAAASQRTRNIRLGHGIVQLPPLINHPARIAERIATLDLVSDGRCDFGTGEGAAEIELGGFNIPHEEKRAMWLEGLRVVTRMLVEEPFTGHEGKYLKAPVRNVVPKPLQRPHPPLWLACSRRETILLAAKLGLGALTFSFVSPEEARQWVNDYYTTLENECEPVGYAINPNIAIVTGFMCDENAEFAHKMGEEGLKFFSYALGHHYAFGKHEPGKTNIWNNFKASPFTLPGWTASNSCVGSPDQIRTRLREFEEAGVDQVVFISQAGNNKHEDICSSLEPVRGEGAAGVQGARAEARASKAERMAPIIEKAMKRKPEPKIPKHDGPTVVQAGMLV